MGIGKKLNLAFYSIIILLCITVGISFLNLNTIEDKTDEALNNRVEQIRTIDEIRFGLAMQGLYARALMLDNTKENEENLAHYQSYLDDQIAYLKTLTSSTIMKDYQNEICSRR